MTTAIKARSAPPATTAPTARNPARTALPSLPSLTGLRWVAALLVFGLHVHNFHYFGGTPGALLTWGFGAGAAGVSFFFILSGFVLMWSARPNDRARAFWRRRIARILPVHLVTAALALLMAVTLTHQARPTPVQGLANVFLVHSWWRPWWQTLDPVSWSLACEAFFYAAFPLLALLLRRLSGRASAGLAGLSVLAVLVLAWADAHHWFSQSPYSFPAARLPEFVLGAAVARLVLLGRWRGPGPEGSLALAIIGYFLVPQVATGYPATVCTVVGFALLIPAMAVADLRGAPSLWRGRRLVRLGELSFAFYMIHVMVLRAGTRLLGNSPRFGLLGGLAATAAAFAVSLGLAWLLYEAVERPARRLLLRPRGGRAKSAAAGRPESPEPASARSVRAGTPEPARTRHARPSSPETHGKGTAPVPPETGRPGAASAEAASGEAARAGAAPADGSRAEGVHSVQGASGTGAAGSD